MIEEALTKVEKAQKDYEAALDRYNEANNARQRALQALNQAQDEAGRIAADIARGGHPHSKWGQSKRIV